MKLLFSTVLILFAFFPIMLYTQEFTIEVKYDYHYIHDISKVQPFAELKYSNNYSIFIVHRQEFDPQTITFDDNDKMQGILIDFKDEVFKDFNKNLYYSYAKTKYQEKAILKESLTLDWKINSKELKKYFRL